MRLEAYLEKHDITAPQFAALIGVHRASVNRFIKGLAFPRIDTIRRIERVTEGRVTANDFVNPRLEYRARIREFATVR